VDGDKGVAPEDGSHNHVVKLCCSVVQEYAVITVVFY
jgi:hypothetical protein